ncbi:MAG: hypothetical protein IKQ13_02555 [Treponema sp.]|nr:hypothetical protein [Treponema sp.]
MLDSEKRISEICYDKDRAIIYFFNLVDDEYGFIKGVDYIKKMPFAKYENGFPCLGFGYGGLFFRLNNIDFKFYYDEMLGVWIETKDINEKSIENQKEKFLGIAQEILNAILEEEKKYTLENKESEIYMKYTKAELENKSNVKKILILTKKHG